MNSLLSVILFCVLAVQSNGIALRLVNADKQTFKKLSITIGDKIYKFENVKSGDITEPIFLKGSYSYFLTAIITENDTIISYPTTYKGQRFYDRGNLTVRLKIDEFKGKKLICFSTGRQR